MQSRRPIDSTLVKIIFCCSVSVALLVSTAIAAPADLDPSFGVGGKVVTSPDGLQNSGGESIAVQSDGKIVMVGRRISGPSIFIVARYNPDGSPDTTFNNTGWTTVSFDYTTQWATNVAIQADGKIVVGGNVAKTVNNTPHVDFGIARFNSDGTVDTGFATGGRAAISFNDLIGGEGHTEYMGTLKIGSDGKIFAAGVATLSATEDRFVLTKLNSDGSFDTTFGTGGRFLDISLGSATGSELNDLVILPDGSIVAACQYYTFIGSYRVVIKYGATGGRIWEYKKPNTIGSPNNNEGLAGIAALPDGKFIVAGIRAGLVAVLRINGDGTEDTSFINAPPTHAGWAHSVAIQPDGKIVAGLLFTNGNGNFSVARYNSDGSLDSTFGAGGFAIIPPLSTADEGRSLVIQPDGKILVGGIATTVGPTTTQNYFAMVRYRGGNLVADKALFDYDGDLKSDISVFRPSNGAWYLNRSTAGFTTVQWGASTDRIAPADYDGDGKTDIAIYRDGDWWILQSSNSVARVINFGAMEDKPQPADFDGDGLDDAALFRPSNGAWYVLRSTDNGYHAVQFGASDDIPQRADYDDDGKADLAIFRPSNGSWYVQKTTGGFLIMPFGTSGDVPVAGDYDGDGKPDLAVWRPSSGDWYILKTSNGLVDRINFGVQNDIPVPAEYNGDGKVDIAIFRPSTGVWYQLLSPSGQWAQQVFGVSGDRPTPSAFNP